MDVELVDSNEHNSKADVSSMMSSSEYRAFLAARKKQKAASVKHTPFLDWLLKQITRQDAIGVLARDVESEQRRIGKPLTALNNRIDLTWYCTHAPASVRLTRKHADVAWAAWVESGTESKRNDDGPILFYDI